MTRSPGAKPVTPEPMAHGSGDIAPQDGGQLQRKIFPIRPAAEFEVDGIDTAGRDPDKHLARTGDRIGHIFNLQLLWTTIFMQNDRFHRDHL
jgi:hypothetical protein